jgi:general secretion pathway protein G
MENLVNKRSNQRGREEGFTLIELLIVIVVLGVLSAIVLFAVGSARDDAVASSCKAERVTIETAQEGYKAKNLGGYASTFALLVGSGTDSFLKATPTKFTMSGGGTNYALAPVAPCTAANSNAAAGGGGGGGGTTTTTIGGGGGTTTTTVAASPPLYVSGGSLGCSNSCNTGETATASVGTWSGSPAPTFAYAWYRNDSGSASSPCPTGVPSGGGWSSLSGTGSTRTVPANDNNDDSLLVRITATNSQGSASRNLCVTYQD